ncbi:MAG: hypothetical protein ABR568_23005, partial [Pyrinomonadaceae bacterium]
TGKVADVVNLEDGRTGVLQMVFAQAAVQRAAMLDFGGKAIGHGARFCIREGFDVVLGVAGNLDFKVAVLGTLLLHPDAVVAEHNVSVDDFFAGGANRARV